MPYSSTSWRQGQTPCHLMLPAVVRARGCAIIAPRREQSAWNGTQFRLPTTCQLNSAPTGEADNQPLLKIRSKTTKGEVVVYLDEMRHLVDALAKAAANLAAAEAGRHG